MASKKLQREIDAFNKRFPVGSEVTVATDSGLVDTTVKYPASILGDHTAVGWFTDIRGCYLLSRAGERRKP